jgi:FkbH-like protein
MLHNAGDYEAYLESLDSVAEIEPFNELTLPRTHQLLQRSNQFNLTTRRHAEGALRQYAVDQQKCLAFTVRLQDRVSNHGIVSVFIAEAIADSLVIDSWVMSCRVLSRYVEEIVFGEALRFARSRGLGKIYGTYIQTAKNSMVAGLLPKFGFRQVETAGDTTQYALDVATAVSRANLPVRVVHK